MQFTKKERKKFQQQAENTSDRLNEKIDDFRDLQNVLNSRSSKEYGKLQRDVEEEELAFKKNLKSYIKKTQKKESGKQLGKNKKVRFETKGGNKRAKFN